MATTVTEPPLLGVVTAFLKGGISAASASLWSLSRCAGNLHLIYKVNVYLYRLQNTLSVVQGSKVFGNVEPNTADSRQEMHQDWNNLPTKKL